MGVLTGTTAVTHPESGAPVVLHEGTELPDWAEGMVGEHLLDEEKRKPAARSRKSE